MKRIPWFYHCLLYLYPARFRKQFASEMTVMFRSVYVTKRRRWTRFTFWLTTVLQVLVFAGLEWKDTIWRLGSRRRSAKPIRRSYAGEGTMSFVNDLRLATRTLLRRPSFSLAAIVTLALGIGANTAVFSAVDGILWRPLAYGQPDRLVALWPDRALSTRDVEFLREHGQDVFESVASIAGWSLTLSGVDNPTHVYGARTSANLFATLATGPLLGRVFRPEDDLVGAAPVVVLSHQIWNTRFGADSAIIGSLLTIDGEAHEVVGVMGPHFEIFNPTMQLWVPLGINEGHWTYTANISRVVARLESDVSVAQANERFALLLRGIRDQYGLADNYGNSATVVDLKGHLVGAYRPVLFVLLGAVVLILLIAGSNLSNLILVKAGAQTSEYSLRAALGASRARLIQLMVAEALVLTMVGGLLGLLLAFGGVHVLKNLIPADTPRIGVIGIDTRVLAACLVASSVSGMLFSILPAVVATRRNLRSAIGQNRTTSGNESSAGRVRYGWVTLQIALAVMLVVGASLMIQTTRGLLAVDPGFDETQVLTLRVQPIGAAFDEPEEYRAFYDRVQERVAGVPGVISVGGVQHLPFSGWEWGTPFEFVEAPVREGEARPVARWRIVMGDYLETLRIPVLAGRGLSPSDRAGTESVALVNQAFADAFMDGGNPLGRQMRLGSGGETTVTVVGMVGDVLSASLDERPSPTIYRPLSQSTMPAIMLAVRTEGDPHVVAQDVQRAIWSIDADTPLSYVMPLAELVGESLGQTRLVMSLLTVFASVALVLGAVGVYGVTSFTVSRQRNEIGIRKALGASDSRVMHRILRHGLSNAALGTLFGLVGAAMLSRFLSDLVFEVRPTDPTTFAFVASLMFVVAGAACALPAWRAMRIDPALALRTE